MIVNRKNSLTRWTHKKKQKYLVFYSIDRKSKVVIIKVTAVIRFPGFKLQDDPKKFYQSFLLLYLSWRQEPEFIAEDGTNTSKILDYEIQQVVKKNQKQFEKKFLIFQLHLRATKRLKL